MVDEIPDPGSGSASRNLSINKQKNVTKFLKIVFRMFILDSGYGIWIFPTHIGVKKAPDPGS
jgi:hypothetical protein